MSSPAITTVVKMMESLPEDLQDEIKWDNSFNKTQEKLIASAQCAKREIVKPSLSESIAQFRQELIDKEIEVNPDEVWGNIRDYVPGREVIW